MRPWLGPHRGLLQRVAAPILEFLQIETAGGIVLVGAAALALIWANSPWGEAYERLWTTRITLDLGPLLFITGLAFPEGAAEFEQAKLGLFAAAVAAAIAGVTILLAAARRSKR